MALGRRELGPLLATIVLVGTAVVATVFLVLNQQLTGPAASIDEPVRISTSDFDVHPSYRSQVEITVRFRAAGRVVSAKVGGPTTVNSDVAPTLRIVYDRSEPTRTMLADDYDEADSTTAKVTPWVCLAVLLLDLAIVILVVVRTLRRTAGMPAGAVPEPGTK